MPTLRRSGRWILAAFAIPHQQQAAAEVNIADVGACGYPEAEACAVEQLEDRAIAYIKPSTIAIIPITLSATPPW